jgi:hypothetical protein
VLAPLKNHFIGLLCFVVPPKRARPLGLQQSNHILLAFVSAKVDRTASVLPMLEPRQDEVAPCHYTVPAETVSLQTNVSGPNARQVVGSHTQVLAAKTLAKRGSHN